MTESGGGVTICKTHAHGGFILPSNLVSTTAKTGPGSEATPAARPVQGLGSGPPGSVLTLEASDWSFYLFIPPFHHL